MKIKYCIDNHAKQKIKIDFNQCTLDGVPINIGNEKEVVNTIVAGNNSKVPINIYEKEVINSTVIGDNSQVSFFIEDWALVQDELKKACKELPKSSKEHIASEEALKCAMNRDEDGLFKIFNKYSESFCQFFLKV